MGQLSITNLTLFEDVFKLSLSEGTLFNVTWACYKKLEDYENHIKKLLKESPVVHFDESGVRVGRNLSWLHSASTETLTYYEMHKNRGREAMDDIGIVPDFKGVAVHDHWKPYFHYEEKHGLCNAHHLRELTYYEEQYAQEWSKKMKEHLVEIKKEVDACQTVGRLKLTPERLSHFSRKYSHILKEGLKEIPTVHLGEKKRG